MVLPGILPSRYHLFLFKPLSVDGQIVVKSPRFPLQLLAIKSLKVLALNRSVAA